MHSSLTALPQHFNQAEVSTLIRPLQHLGFFFLISPFVADLLLVLVVLHDQILAKLQLLDRYLQI